MFDEKPKSQNNPPQDLPTASPVPPRPTGQKEHLDLLGEVDLDKSQIRGPAQPKVLARPEARPQVPPAVRPPEKSVSKEPFFVNKKGIVVLAIAALVIAALAGAGWYAYGLLSSRPASMGTESPVNTNQPPETLDTDRDGLSDEEEALYGTDINKIDTDLDGLTDRDEVKVFKTDPNNPDTDGDTYLDGEEVRAGYDPKGEGRLLRIE